MKAKKMQLALLSVLMLALSACGEISKDIKQQAEQAKASAAKAQGKIDTVEKEMQAALSGPEADYLKKYSAEWPKWIKSSKSMLAAAQSDIAELDKVLERNKPEEGPKVVNLIREIRNKEELATSQANKVSARIEELLRFKKESDKLIARADNDHSTAVKMLSKEDSSYAQLLAGVQESQTKYPDKKGDLEKRWQQIVHPETGLLGVVQANLNLINKESAKGAPDYGKIGDASNKINEIAATTIPVAMKELQQRVNELNHGYEKIIHDLKKIPRYIVLYSDYSNCDWCGPDETQEVTKDVYDGIVLYKDSNSWQGRPVSRMSRKGWYYAEEKWIDYDYFVRYRMVTDGGENIGDWENVSEEFYENNFDNVGMAVESKPRGRYASEKAVGVRPPGYEYVGNPHYGQWRGDSWAFYPRYSYMPGLFWGAAGVIIYRSGWNHWYGGYRSPGGRYYGQPYYGRQGQFGTFGTTNRERMKDRLIFSQNRGEFKTSTVRAGASRRGRGPGGAGK